MGRQRFRFEFRPPFAYRGKLSGWAFDEMGNVKALAGKLMDRPLRADSLADRAGPPFQLPYSLAVPGRERDWWWTHRDILDASIRLCEELIPGEPAGDREYLTRLVDDDRRRREQLTRLMHGGPDPDTTPDLVFRDLLKAKRATAQNRRGADASGDTEVAVPAGEVRRHRAVPAHRRVEPARPQPQAYRPEEAGRERLLRADQRRRRDGGQVLRGRDRDRAELDPVPARPFPDGSRPRLRGRHPAAVSPEGLSFVFDLSKFEDVRDNAEAIHALG